ncbi:MAG: GNAT family N-acetyltransferase [Oscillospiraceae bacterium]|nr:GNAT family N-acetyltransferase [Oscillospiraceae bacterium]
MTVREARAEDLQPLLNLYTHLHNNPVPEIDSRLLSLWERILNDPDHHILLADADGQIAASCVVLIVPNLTNGQRPYALIENVVTHAAYRRRGYATACLHAAKQIAEREGCYKIMLMTGAKDAGRLHFYEQAGFDRHEKTAFIQRL